MFKIRRTPDNRIYLCGWNEWPVEREILSPSLAAYLIHDKKVCKEPFGMFVIHLEEEDIINMAVSGKLEKVWGGLLKPLAKVVFPNIAELLD